eukprot:gene14699-17367_t
MGKIIKKGTTGNAANYTTRNQALKRLQLKLEEFRRLCILKGVHPREPKKKRQGQGKTYYHVKDINFLAHEPLLEQFRTIRSHKKKIVRAKGKKEYDLAERLKNITPGYRLDHLVKERYPSFIDALRDLDDPLSLIHLFAVLPAEKRLKVNNTMVQKARRLSLEFQAYVSRTHALRKVFVSVKGIYYQAEILGQLVTWIVPHALAQHIPIDVDYRVMTTFLDFYEVLLEFVNFKLYHQLGLKYPPNLNSHMEDAATGLMAVMHEMATSTGATGLLEASAPTPNPESKVAKESEKRLSTLKDKMADLTEGDAEEEEHPRDAEAIDDAEEDMKVVIRDEHGQESQETHEEDECGNLFKGLVFYLGRETNRESLGFVIQCFGGKAGWEGEGSPIEGSDPSITHSVSDRPNKGHRFLSRDYVTPQWVYDSINFRVLTPTEGYQPGMKPPPHLSPFVDNEAEGYMPEYADTMRRLQEASKSVNLDAAAEVQDDESRGTKRTLDNDEDAAEKEYAAELAAEIAGVSYAQSLQKHEDEEEEDEEEDDEKSDEEAAPGKSAPLSGQVDDSILTPQELKLMQ